MDQPFDLRALPRPTTEQYAAFAEHVGEAHSWYKHIPLLTGNEFVVFLAQDAGIGRLHAHFTANGLELVTPPDGALFTEANPRLHYSWTTTEEYRRRFGYLDYARGFNGEFGRDVGGAMELPDEIWKRCQFTLYPYVARGDSGRRSVSWAHENAIAELRKGASHPKRELLLEWARLFREYDAACDQLTQDEQDAIFNWRYRKGPPPSTPATTTCLERETALDTLYNERLRAGEVAKIKWALDELRSWLENG